MDTSTQTDTNGDAKQVTDDELELALTQLRSTGKYDELMDALRSKLSPSWSESITNTCNQLVQEKGYVQIPLYEMIKACESRLSLDPTEAMSPKDYDTLVCMVVKALQDSRDELSMRESLALHSVLSGDDDDLDINKL